MLRLSKSAIIREVPDTQKKYTGTDDWLYSGTVQIIIIRNNKVTINTVVLQNALGNKVSCIYLMMADVHSRNM